MNCRNVYVFIYSLVFHLSHDITRARFLSLTQGMLRLRSANHRAGYFSNLACDLLSIVWTYFGQETESGTISLLSFYDELQNVA